MVHSFILVILSNSLIAFKLGGQIVEVGRRPIGELLLMISILPWSIFGEAIEYYHFARMDLLMLLGTSSPMKNFTQ
jgi:hypothetical protein